MHQGARGAITADSLNDLTPPQYGEHQLDLLYSDIDPSGYMTPAGVGTGANTPISAQSRSVSGDDLAAIETMEPSLFAANVLQNRLSNLDIAGARSPRLDRGDRVQLSTLADGTPSLEVSNTHRANGNRPQQGSPPSHNGGYFAHGEGSYVRQFPNDGRSRSVSEEEILLSGSHSPEHVEYTAENLAKVPSYSTALRANPRTPVSNGLPSYHTATRMPMPTSPMPVHTSDSGASHQRPQMRSDTYTSDHIE